ncbi:MAG: diguanylate cyclase [Alphaproteobacteria bacterium]|nr:diguanylate cyclase [Alphaproteobacteria bacterium]
MAERIREAVKNDPILVDGKKTSITVSIGVTSVASAADDLNSLLGHADKALYDAKAGGRDKVSQR